MAEPIPLEIPARDPRAELLARLQRAPAEHAEALLSAYEVLQGLHDRGVFELARGALGSGDKLVEMAMDASKTPEMVRGLRNALTLVKILGSIDPEVVEALARSIAETAALAGSKEEESPGFWKMARKTGTKNYRRGFLLVNSFFEAIGKNLPRRKK